MFSMGKVQKGLFETGAISLINSFTFFSTKKKTSTAFWGGF